MEVKTKTNTPLPPHKNPSSYLQWYLKLDVVYGWRRDDAVEGSETMLVANLLAVQLKLRLTDLPIHIQRYHRL